MVRFAVHEKYETSCHTRSTKPNKPSRLISPPDQPEPSDATDPQDPPETSSGLWRFSQNFTKVNLLLPKLPKPRSAHVHRGREKGGALSWFQLSQFSTAGEADRGVPTNREDGRQCWSSRLLCQTVSLHKHDHKVGALSFGFFFVTRSSKSD